MKKYMIKGMYTYRVQKEIKANSYAEAWNIAINHLEPLCEWDSQDQDTYFERVQDVKTIEEYV